MKRKWLAIGIILLFVVIPANPITGFSHNRDDTTPPVTICTLYPPEPDGQNGWYINNVTVTLLMYQLVGDLRRTLHPLK